MRVSGWAKQDSHLNMLLFVGLIVGLVNVFMSAAVCEQKVYDVGKSRMFVRPKGNKFVSSPSPILCRPDPRGVRGEERARAPATELFYPRKVSIQFDKDEHLAVGELGK